MKICVCSAATENLKWEYEFTNKLKEAYCKKHGYDYIFEEIKSLTEESYHYRKNMILRLMEREYDWIVWMDADAWFNRFDKSIEELILKNPTKNMIVARDHYVYDDIKRWYEAYINSGVVLIKNTKSGERLLKLWMNCTNAAKLWVNSTQTKLQDQPFLCLKILFDVAFEKEVSILEPEEMNWFVLFGDIADKFILHAAGVKKITKITDFYAGMLQTAITEKMDLGFISSLQDRINKETSKNNDKKNNHEINESLAEKPMDIKMKLKDVFIPQGFELTPTLREPPDYDNPIFANGLRPISRLRY